MSGEVEDLQALLDEFKISKTRQEKIMAIVEPLAGQTPLAVLPTDTRGCVVETVEAYGLVIEVDANGRAARVSLPMDRGSASHTDGLDIEWAE